jgi:hypothetical protein
LQLGSVGRATPSVSGSSRLHVPSQQTLGAGRRRLAPARAMDLIHQLSSLAEHLPLAYEPVAAPCSLMNCGDVVHRRYVSPAGCCRASTSSSSGSHRKPAFLPPALHVALQYPGPCAEEGGPRPGLEGHCSVCHSQPLLLCHTRCVCRSLRTCGSSPTLLRMATAMCPASSRAVCADSITHVQHRNTDSSLAILAASAHSCQATCPQQQWCWLSLPSPLPAVCCPQRQVCCPVRLTTTCQHPCSASGQNPSPRWVLGVWAHPFGVKREPVSSSLRQHTHCAPARPVRGVDRLCNSLYMFAAVAAAAMNTG